MGYTHLMQKAAARGHCPLDLPGSFAPTPDFAGVQ
jgi:hypothetical protein